MANRKYYVFCENRCLFEGMTKEQTLAAIEQAVTTGEIKDVDAGFITKVKEQNKNVALKFWVGTQTEYNAIETKENNCFYIITDDTAKEDIETAIENLQREINTLNEYVGANLDGINKPVVLFKGELHEGETVTIPDFEKYIFYAIEICVKGSDGFETRETLDGVRKSNGVRQQAVECSHFSYNGEKFEWRWCFITSNGDEVKNNSVVFSDWGATDIKSGYVTKITGIA